MFNSQNNSKEDKVCLIDSFSAMDTATLKEAIRRIIVRHFGKDHENMNENDIYQAITRLIHEDMNLHHVRTKRKWKGKAIKRVFYLSMEFLPGKQFKKDLINKKMYQTTKEAVEQLGFDFEKVQNIEQDSALGNGGLGRLAAGFLDAATTHDYVLTGHGILYEFGLFRQEINHGEQREQPENWLRYGGAWLTERAAQRFFIKFYGSVKGDDSKEGRIWIPGEQIEAVGYDMPISGYGTSTVNRLRLWRAFSSSGIDFQKFNEGNYIDSVADQVKRETISKILYPNDSNLMGQELRLKQEYFFVSAALQDVFLSYKREGIPIHDFDKYLAFHLNDTHPALATLEFIRLLVDEYSYDFRAAVKLCQSVFTIQTTH